MGKVKTSVLSTIVGLAAAGTTGYLVRGHKESKWKHMWKLRRRQIKKTWRSMRSRIAHSAASTGTSLMGWSVRLATHR